MTAPPRRYSGTWSNIPPSKSCGRPPGRPGGGDGTVYKAVTRIDGVDTAQVMLVLGSSEGGEHPNWMQNLSLACRIQESMNTLYPTLARPMTMRSSRYNQQLSNGSLLVEVGTHGNTLQEALAGARLFARAAGQVLLGLKE